MIKSRTLVPAIVGASLVMGCSTTGSGGSKSVGGYPDWYTNPPQDDGAFYGTSCQQIQHDDIDLAKLESFQSAKRSIAKQIRERVEEVTKESVKKSTASFSDSAEEGSSSKQVTILRELTNESESIVNETLIGVKPSKSEVIGFPDGRTLFCSLAVLDQQKTNSLIASVIKGVNETIDLTPEEKADLRRQFLDHKTRTKLIGE